MTADVEITLNDGTVRHFEVFLKTGELHELKADDLSRRMLTEERLIRELLATNAAELQWTAALPELVQGWQLRVPGVPLRAIRFRPPKGVGPAADRGGPARAKGAMSRQRIRRSRTLLQVANKLVSERFREDALDEWMDEIECAAADGRPVFRRTVSILLRSLPPLIWRSRFSARVRREGN